MTWILQIACVSFIIAFTCGSNFYKLPNFDMDQKSCKYVISSLVDIDNEFFGLLSLWYPPISMFAKKHLKTIGKRDVALVDPTGRLKRSLIGDVMGLISSKAPMKLMKLVKEKFVGDIMIKFEKFYRHFNNCTLWAKDYVDYWQGIVQVILNDQQPIFLEGL